MNAEMNENDVTFRTIKIDPQDAETFMERGTRLILINPQKADDLVPWDFWRFVRLTRMHAE